MKQEEKKHREFWVEVNIQDHAQNAGWKFHRAWTTDFEMLHSAGINTVRFIEYSAYEQLKAKLEKAKKVIQFYASCALEDMWEPPFDGGSKSGSLGDAARAVLKEI